MNGAVLAARFGIRREELMAENDVDAIEVLAGVLPGIVEGAATIRSETTLALLLGTTSRRLNELRRAGLVRPRRLGRGWVYTPADVRRTSVLVTLQGLGATTEDLVSLLGGGAERCSACDRPRSELRCAPARCCETFLEALRARTEDEIVRLRALDGLLQQYAVEVWQTSDR